MKNCEYKSRCKFYDTEWCSTVDAEQCHYHKILTSKIQQAREHEAEQRRHYENNDIGLARFANG
jgi:hypothetical protein